MPCTIEPWEVDLMERSRNKRKYGMDITDQHLVTKLLCEAIKLLDDDIKKGSKALQRWGKLHAARDEQKKIRKRVQEKKNVRRLKAK